MKKFSNLRRNIQNWLAFYALRYFGKAKAVFQTHNGIHLPIEKGRELIQFTDFFVNDSYDTAFLQKIIPFASKTVISAGAKTGIFTGFILNMYPAVQVIGLEPLPVNIRKFKQMAGLNPGRAIVTAEKALTDRDGITDLYFSDNDDFVATTAMHFSGQQKNILKVETASLNTIIEEYSLKNIDLLFLDCQGAEYEILYNMPAQVMAKISTIVLKLHQSPKADENIDYFENFLKNAGFSVRFNNSTEILWAWR